MNSASATTTRTISGLVLVALLTGACAHQMGGHKRDPANPQLTFENGQLRSADAILVFEIGGPPVDIVWHLDPKSGVRFSENGIVPVGQLKDEVIRGDRPAVVLDPNQHQVVKCHATGKDGLTFTCTNNRTETSIIKLDVNVTDGQKSYTWDPAVVNW